MSSVPDKNRVVFVVGSSDEPGASSAAYWAAELSAQGIDAEMVSFWRLPGDDGRDRIASLAGRVDTEEVRAVVGVGTIGNLAAIDARRLTLRRPALIATEHELLTPRRRRSSALSRSSVIRAGREYRHADIVTGSSHALAAEINAGFAVPASRSLVVPEPALAGPSPFGDRVGGDPQVDQSLTVIIAGELTAANGPLRVVAAAGEIKRRGLPVRLVCRPEGPLLSAVTAAAAAHGLHVRMVDAPSIGARSVVVLGAEHSGLGIDLVHAAHGGLPSVASSTALGVADAIIPGVTGELAVAVDPAALADAIVAASVLEVAGIDDWLERFSAASSTRLLRRAIDMAVLRSEAASAVSA